MNILDRIIGAIFNDQPVDRSTEIPPPATMYGDGPDYVNDTRGGVAPWVGNPYAPQLGRDLPTLGEQRRMAEYGQDDYYRDAEPDTLQRSSVEQIQTTGFYGNPQPPGSNVPVVRSMPVGRPVTDSSHPELYSFIRPFNQETERDFNGDHFSMADHKREYDIYGMQPVYQRRNTYRTEPAQWDTNIVDKVDTAEPVTYGYDATATPDRAPSSSYRL